MLKVAIAHLTVTQVKIARKQASYSRSILIASRESTRASRRASQRASSLFDSGKVVRNQAGPLRRAGVDCEPVVVRLPRAERSAQLPEQVGRHARGRERRALPLALDAAMVARRPVCFLSLALDSPCSTYGIPNSQAALLTFFKQAGLAGSGARLAVGLDPGVAPVVLGAPGAGVQVEGAEVEGADLEVGGEVEALAELVRVAAVAGEAEPFVAERDHVRRVEALDVGRRRRCPVGDDAGGAPVAPRLVRQLPGEDGRRVGVPRYYRLDVRLVLRLRRRVGVPRRLRAAEGRYVLDASFGLASVDHYRNQALTSRRAIPELAYMRVTRELEDSNFR